MLHSIYCLNGSKRFDKKLPAWISDRIPTWTCSIHLIWTSWGLHRRIQQGPFAFVQAKTFVLSFFLLLPKHATKNIKILLNWFYYSFCIMKLTFNCQFSLLRQENLLEENHSFVLGHLFVFLDFSSDFEFCWLDWKVWLSLALVALVRFWNQRKNVIIFNLYTLLHDMNIE